MLSGQYASFLSLPKYASTCWHTWTTLLQLPRNFLTFWKGMLLYLSGILKVSVFMTEWFIMYNGLYIIWLQEYRMVDATNKEANVDFFHFLQIICFVFLWQKHLVEPRFYFQMYYFWKNVYNCRDWIYHQCKRYASCSLGYLRFKVTCVADVNFGVLQLCNYPQV